MKKSHWRGGSTAPSPPARRASSSAVRLGQALDWAVAQARVKGFAHVAVAREPTGPRWMQVQRLCAERGLPMVCVQPLVSHIAREQQDYTPHKTDESDCVLIGRLAAELHCYIPEELDKAWAHLRHTASGMTVVTRARRTACCA